MFSVGTAAISDPPRPLERAAIADTTHRSALAHTSNAALGVRVQQRESWAGRHASYQINAESSSESQIERNRTGQEKWSIVYPETD